MKKIIKKKTKKTPIEPVKSDASVPENFPLAYTHLRAKGRTVIFIHGLTANRRIFTPMAQFLHRHGFDVVTYDLRGRGDSFKPEKGYGIENHVSDLENLINHLNYKKPVILIGHSFGANIALAFVRRHPAKCRGLVLLDGGAELSVFQKLKVYFSILPSLRRIGKVFPSKESYLTEVKKKALIKEWTSETEEFLLSELTECEGGVCSVVPYYVIEQELNAIGADPNPWKFLKKILLNPYRAYLETARSPRFPYYSLNCPVLIIRASRYNFRPGDQVLPEKAAETMKNQIPNAELRTFPLNHYELVLSKNIQRDEAILNFLLQLPNA